MERSHGVVIPQTLGVDVGGVGPERYTVSIPRVLKLVVCLLGGCLVSSHNSGIFIEHFMYLNWKAEIMILWEVPAPLPRCGHCGIHMPETRLGRHRRTSRCEMATEMNLQQISMEMAERLGKMGFIFYSRERYTLA